MLDARPDEVLCRIDTITNRLAASNCGHSDLLSMQEETTLLQELQQLNASLAVRFTVASGRTARAPRPLVKVFGAACAGTVLLFVVMLVFMTFSAIVYDIATSFSQMARPVP